MKSSLDLLKDLVRTAPFQPATNYWRAVELDAVQRHGLPMGRGLDLGCGDGKLSVVLLDALGDNYRRQTELVGIDLDPLETAQAEKTRLYAKVYTGSAAEVPETSGSFDFVFSNSVLEHIPPIAGVLAEAARLLRPGGRFVFTVPGPDFHACLGGPVMFGRRDAAYFEEIDRRCAHLRYWDRQTWSEQLRACGLRIDQVREYLSLRQAQRWERLSTPTGGLLYTLGGKKNRPIEIQRKLRMRSAAPGALGSFMAAASPVLTWGCPANVAGTTGPYACLLIDAVKA